MHQAVLLHEIVEYLNLAPGKTILDCTVGCGGHARAILELITPGGVLIGIDQDKDALEIASENLKRFKGNIRLVHDSFRNFKSILSELNIGEVDGVLFDLGLSSLQLEQEERGFSIRLNGPLDMRMDRRLKIDAAFLVNTLSEQKTAEILREFGEERRAKRIAKAIVAGRPVKTTRQLAEIVSRAVPVKHKRIHPATRTFQALRIAVNHELEALDSALGVVPDRVRKGGRICVVSFHSLEDRIVKNKFRDCKRRHLFKIITKKPITPQTEEVLINPRSRSAKLRVAERI